MRSALALAALTVACARAATPAASPAPTAAGHHDPAPPLALVVAATQQGDEATMQLRVTTRQALASVTVAVDLPQGVERVDGDVRKTFTPVADDATLTLRLRVRRVGAGGPFTLRAWTEAREATALYGDERAVVVFGSPAQSSPTAERVVVTPDGARLHDTLIP